MQSHEIRQRFLDFFANEKRGSHAIIQSTPLPTVGDPSALFITAGMQPLVPYLMGQKHPLGNRLASCQKCVRTGDLDDIGDNRHFSFFEMLGNWSLGDYFKEKAIKWSYEFLTSKEEGLGLDPTRLAVTIFQGDENAPYDQESKDIWLALGIPEHRIYALPADDNWWSPGDNGPCGPCSEMFYDMAGEFVGKEISHDDFLQLVEQEKLIEIWNDVFMEYEKRDGNVIGKLAQKNVDTGAGLERLTAVMQGKSTAYQTDIFENVIKTIKQNSSSDYETHIRIIADHIRTSLFMISDGVIPGNKEKGYVLRRLLRRAATRAQQIGITNSKLIEISYMYGEFYQDIYPSLFNPQNNEVIRTELDKFQKTLIQGLKEFDKYFKGTYGVGGLSSEELNRVRESESKKLRSDAIFNLVTTYGFPFEIIKEIAGEKGIFIEDDEIKEFDKKMQEHQKLSQSASAGMFKGGLANTNEKTVQLHTAHHLLLAALQQVLGPEVKQRGSNITEERLRIDFVFDRKMTDEEKSEVEKIVNEKIQAKLPVVRKEMKREDAEQIGAQMEFGAKYPDTVSVYMIGGEDAHAFSKEFCGGPHVENTGDLSKPINPSTGLGAKFKILKEEASSAGVRRIKAILQ